MHRVLILPLVCLSVAGAAGACSRDRDRHQENATTAAYKDSERRDALNTDQIEVTGCVTANQETNQFVLTANSTALTSLTNRAGAGDTDSYHYQLVGGTNLQDYVGKEVVVKGSVEGKPKDVNIETKEKAAGAPKSHGEATPAVESRSEIDMQVQRLNVAAVTPTGGACQIGQHLGQRR